jgi:hypothetical protein
MDSVLYDHSVSLDQAFQVDRFSPLNRQREAADPAYRIFLPPYSPPTILALVLPAAHPGPSPPPSRPVPRMFGY